MRILRSSVWYLCYFPFRFYARRSYLLRFQRVVAILLIVHLRPPTAPLLLTNLRSCCATCPTRQQKPESHVVLRTGCRSTSARNARHALRCTLQKAWPVGEVAWAYESPIP